ncbi:helix-turn-helix domain-containing protein [Kocuria rhizophila]|uniref:helix-turn-helix domain-containing protein n=1 Tax=Kocuria rhizophila TaxID=72000 RepID=UPI0034DAD0EC
MVHILPCGVGTPQIVCHLCVHQSLRGGPHRSEAQKAEARRLFASGATRRELMEMYGVSESTIKRILRTHAP